MDKRLKKYLTASFVLSILALLVSAAALLVSTGAAEEKAPVRNVVLTTDRFSAHVDKNEDGETLYVTLGDESGLPFSQAVVTITENTSLYTLNGTRIAIRPERISGAVLVKFSTVEKIEGDTAHLRAEEILCSAD